MYPVPAGWAARLVTNHQIRTQATLCAYGDPIYALPAPLVQGGSAPSVSYDLTTSRRSTMTCSFDAGDLMAITGTDLVGGSGLDPAGNEIALSSTVDDGLGGWFPWVPLGQFGITATSRPDSDNAPGPVVTLAGEDRSQVIGASKVLQTVVIASGTPIAAAIAILFTTQVPWIPLRSYLFDGGDVTLPSQIVRADADPWSTATRWATSNGLTLHLDRLGNIILAPITVPPSPNVQWSSRDGTLLKADPVSDGTKSYNGISVVGSYPGVPPVRATRYDDDASSPTYAEGLFGHRPAPTRTFSTVASWGDADRACAALLPSVLGLRRSITAETNLDVSVDAGDLAQIESDRNPKANGTWQATQIGMTLDASTAMTMTGIPLGAALAATQVGIL